MGQEVIDLSVVMPAFNEQENIENTVLSCLGVLDGLGLRAEVVVADDGSTDNTGRILDDLAKGCPALKVIHRGRNGGYGAAMSEAIRHAKGRLVATIDSDGQFDPEDLPKLLLEIRNGVDCVTGFRKAKQDSLARVIADKGHNHLVRIVTGMKFKDSQCAIKVYRREILTRFDLESSGYSLPTEALVKIRALGGHVSEVEVSHRDRSGGKSKLDFLQTATKMAVFLFYLRLKVELGRKKIIHRL